MRIGLLITARLKSTRLPLKLLLDLNGKSVIERVIERAKLIHNLDEIVICTSINSQDKPLTDIAVKNGIHYFLGSEEDVLKRLLDAACFFDLDYIVSITGENPLFSIEYANRVVDNIKNSKADFTFYEGLPIGCAVYGIRRHALQVVCSVKTEIDTEIWGPLINQPDIFTIMKQEVDPFFYRPTLRITNDYLEDYMFLSTIYSYFNFSHSPTLLQVLQLLDDKPSILDINKEKKQASLDNAVINRINAYYLQNKESILKLKSEVYKN